MKEKAKPSASPLLVLTEAVFGLQQKTIWDIGGIKTYWKLPGMKICARSFVIDI
jgi:hypothetical protein